MYEVGDVFLDVYPVEAAEWCNENDCFIEELDPIGGKRQFVIKRNPKPSKEEEEELFNASFFKTSLGYVRRKVAMKTGETKDFLADILPVLEVGVPILTYTRDLEQKKVAVTEQFLGECKVQILTDFYGDSDV